MSNFYWKAASALGATGVGLAAFGSHGLAKYVDDPNKIKSWSTAAHFQLLNSVALLVLSSTPRRVHPAAMPLILGGTVAFSGSIYLLTLKKREQFRFLGPITPLGGVLLMGGWAALML
ncbi:DUF423-domain-containing protein [Hesseltinella vesiculosa]|uniref:DUF423-domain-containing protein n=1 Tax=Hesseltinella vesiculosa TaxID=101127 RepID=A0A1X2GMD7_9FUNG|nr:DUF423-domain-containing protein [Hesseltinella vesiculosa]